MTMLPPPLDRESTATAVPAPVPSATFGRGSPGRLTRPASLPATAPAAPPSQPPRQTPSPAVAFQASRPARSAPIEAAGPAARRFGPYQMKTLLGHSASTMTWLADDPRSGFEALVCMPRVRPADAAACQTWLHDARRAARIDHPRVGTAFDIGLHDRWPYAAFDRRHDCTLDEWGTLHAAATPADHVALAVEALEGVAFAHEAGVVHRDLQPHHWLVDSHGHLRLIGFDVADAALLHDRRSAAARDVLAVALILHGLLAGRAALDEPDIGLVHRRLPPAGRDVVRLPLATPQRVPEALRAIVDRATARDPRQRYMSARSLLAALDGWRRGETGDGAVPMAALLERVRAVGALPALPGAESRFPQLFGRESERTGAMALQILQEPGLALELLRLVNSSSRQGTGGEPVVTVSRALVLLGLDSVRKAAASLRRWPADDTDAAALEQLLRRARRAGLVAQALCPAGYDGELVYVVALLQNLGRLIVQYHRPQEAGQVRSLMQMAAAEGSPRLRPAALDESAATYAVLGFDAPALADALARQWGLGDDLAAAMQRLDPAKPVGPIAGDWAWLRASASAANEAVDAVSALNTAAATAARAVKAETDALLAVVHRYGPVLRIGIGALRDALRGAAEAMAEGVEAGAKRDA